MTDPEIAPVPPLEEDRKAAIARRAHAVLARETSARDRVEAVVVPLFSVATLAWAVLAVVRIE